MKSKSTTKNKMNKKRNISLVNSSYKFTWKQCELRRRKTKIMVHFSKGDKNDRANRMKRNQIHHTGINNKVIFSQHSLLSSLLLLLLRLLATFIRLVWCSPKVTGNEIEMERQIPKLPQLNLCVMCGVRFFSRQILFENIQMIMCMGFSIWRSRFCFGHSMWS